MIRAFQVDEPNRLVIEPSRLTHGIKRPVILMRSHKISNDSHYQYIV